MLLEHRQGSLDSSGEKDSLREGAESVGKWRIRESSRVESDDSESLMRVFAGEKGGRSYRRSAS